MSEFKEIKLKKPIEDTESPSVSKPSLYFDFDEAPEMENLEFNKEYEITLKVKPESITKREEESGKSGSVRLDVLAYKINTPSKEVEKQSEGSYKQRE